MLSLFFLGQESVCMLWLSEVRRLRKSIPWLVVCEFISLLGSHAVPDSAVSPLQLPWVKGVISFCCNLLTAHLAEWLGVFYLLLLLLHGDGRDTEIRVITVDSAQERFMCMCVWLKREGSTVGECWTHDPDIVGLSPLRSSRRIVFSRINLLSRLFISVLIPPQC